MSTWGIRDTTVYVYKFLILDKRKIPKVKVIIHLWQFLCRWKSLADFRQMC